MNPTYDYSQRPSKILVDLKSLEQNFESIRNKVSGSKVMAVVKANAYGHGLLPCAKRLEASGVDYFGVALIEEGEQLRSAGIKTPIHVFGGIVGSQIERFLKSDLEITASSQDKLFAIEQVAANSGVVAKVHLKIDTGMGRIGVRPESAKKLIELAAKLEHVNVVGIFSHFACSDEADRSYTRMQLEKFLPILAYGKNELGSNVLGHISNSAAILQFPQANLDMVRPGLSLYGVIPASHIGDLLNLKPVMRVQSQVVYFKVVRRGESVSYGRSWIAAEDTRVVTVPIGYGDGYMRALSNKASVIIRGRKYPIVGKICMDQIMVAVGANEVFNGDLVTLIGSEGQNLITVEQLAECAETVPHEILAALNVRMAREFLNKDQ